ESRLQAQRADGLTTSPPDLSCSRTFLLRGENCFRHQDQLLSGSEPRAAGTFPAFYSWSSRFPRGCNLEGHPPAERVRGACDRSEGYAGVRRVQQAIELRAARLDLTGHRLLCDSLLLHLMRQFPGNHALHRHSFHFFPDALFFQKTIEG